MRPSHTRAELTRQRGAAMMVMLVIMIVGGAAFLVSALTSSALKTARQDATSNALAQAKDALIGYAARDSNRPGELPCPDINNDGVISISGPDADYSGSNCISLIGRLPWKTLGLPDLRDGSGERLWYAVSDPFHANDTAVLNSDTLATITVRNSAGNVINNGCSVAGANCPSPGASDAAFNTGAIAVIFSPGDVLTRQGDTNPQDRGSAGVNTPSNYLDKASVGALTEDNADFIGGTSSNGFIQGKIQTYNPANNTQEVILNDQLLVITRDQLFPLIEKRVGNEIKKLLITYYTAQNEFPFAAPFVDPSLPFTDPTKPFIGSANTYYGLVPMGAVWSGIPTYSLANGSADVLCELRTGSNSLANARARCYTTNIVGTPTINITGTLVGLRLWRLHDLTDINQVRVRVNGTSMSASSVPGMNPSASAVLNADGSTTVTFTGTLVPGVERIELRDVVVDPMVDPVDPAYAWFTRNKWHQVMYYAVSSGYTSGNSACNPPPSLPSCLTVNGSGGGNNMRAVLVMSGNALTGQMRPPSTPITINDYLEDENLTPANLIYESKLRSSTFNDQVITVAP